MFHKNKNRQQYQGSVSAQFRRGNATPSRAQRLERVERQQATDRQLSVARKLRHHRQRIRFVALLVAGVLLFIGWRSTLTQARATSDVRLNSSQLAGYQNYIASRVGEHSFIKQGWTLDAPALENDVKQKFPEVKAVRFSVIPLSSRLRAQLSFRRPLLLWKDTGGQTRFLDSAGVLFATDVTAADTKQMTTVEDESGLVVNSGSAALSSATTAMIGEAPEQLKSLYPKGIAAVIIPKSTREVRIQPKGVSYYIKFSTERSLGEQVGELRVLERFFKQKKVLPKTYVDVRLEHKAFYK